MLLQEWLFCANLLEYWRKSTAQRCAYHTQNTPIMLWSRLCVLFCQDIFYTHNTFWWVRFQFSTFLVPLHTGWLLIHLTHFIRYSSQFFIFNCWINFIYMYIVFCIFLSIKAIHVEYTQWLTNQISKLINWYIFSPSTLHGNLQDYHVFI